MCNIIIDDDRLYEKGNAYKKAIQANNRSASNKHLFSKEQIHIGRQILEKFHMAFPKNRVFCDYTQKSIKLKVTTPSQKVLNSEKVKELIVFCRQAGFRLRSRLDVGTARSFLVHFDKI